MTLAIKVFGVQDCIAAFGEIPRAVGNMNMRKAMNAGGGIIRDAAADNVHSESGLAKRSLKVKVRVPDASFNVKHHGRPAYAVIGPARRIESRVARNKQGVLKRITTIQAIRRSFGGGGFTVRRPSRYFHLIERGAKGHPISVKNKRVLAADGNVFGRIVRHPGTKAQQPLSRAVRSAGAAAQAAIIHKLRAGLTEWAQKRAASSAWRSSIRAGAANPLGIGS